MNSIVTLPALALLLSTVATGTLAQNVDSSGCDRTEDIPATGYINNPTCGTTYGSDPDLAILPPPVAPPPGDGGIGGDTGIGDSGPSGASGPGGDDSVSAGINAIGLDGVAPSDRFLLGDENFSAIV